MATVSLDSLNAGDAAGFVAALGEVYEHAPWVAQAASAQRPFASLAALHEAMIAVVRNAPAERRMALLRGHPDLAGKAARAGTTTAASQAEQAGVGLDRLFDDEFAAFHRLNSAYWSRFGFPFILCVRRHGKDSILRQFERRLANDAAAECETALAEIFRIVALRLDQRVTAADKLPVHGHLSTHVLDTYSGTAAAGVCIELSEMPARGEPRLIARALTNRDGRSNEPLIHARPLPIANYRLTFRMGDYFARLGAARADPPFLDVLPVEFAIAEPEGHYHIPLLVTPWSYSTYRGS